MRKHVSKSELGGVMGPRESEQYLHRLSQRYLRDAQIFSSNKRKIRLVCNEFGTITPLGVSRVLDKPTIGHLIIGGRIIVHAASAHGKRRLTPQGAFKLVNTHDRESAEYCRRWYSQMAKRRELYTEGNRRLW